VHSLRGQGKRLSLFTSGSQKERNFVLRALLEDRYKIGVIAAGPLVECHCLTYQRFLCTADP
jgi:hypothetical protein